MESRSGECKNVDGKRLCRSKKGAALGRASAGQGVEISPDISVTGQPAVSRPCLFGASSIPRRRVFRLFPDESERSFEMSASDSSSANSQLVDASLAEVGRPESPNRAGGGARVVVLTTAMLTFISFWHAAAVVLNDLASTAYYIGGIAEHAIGKAAPWFILMVMLFSYCVRAVYIESCSMFVRGGVYRIVSEAMGHVTAKICVSALIFDYLLTGPISAVSAGHYCHGLLTFIAQQVGSSFPVSSDLFAVVFAISVTIYFWWLNVKGLEESSDKALKIMIATTVMVAILISWSLLTLWLRPFQWPPLRPQLTDESLGWLKDVPWMRTFGLAVFFVAFGHSILAMSGEETLAQVYRDIEAPKLQNLKRAASVIFIFSLLFTGFVSFAAVMIVPDDIRRQAGDNLLNELVKHFVGPVGLKLVISAFVVAVGSLILSGAVNTALVGANGVLNRVAEDGSLHDWFRQPHRRYGTTYRILNLIAGLQILTILASFGDVTLLGEAYAFGVVWSFAFKAMSVLVLRYTYHGERIWKVPFNLTVRGIEIPLGLGVITLVLVGVAVTNFFTKPIATVWGCGFTIVFYGLLTISERLIHKSGHWTDGTYQHLEKFAIEQKSELSPDAVELETGKPVVVVPIRDPNNLTHLRAALEEAMRREMEIIAMTVKVEKGEKSFHRVFTKDEEMLFTKVVELAEKYGISVKPLVVPSNNSWFAIAKTAYDLGAEEIFLGKSGRVPPDVQLQQLAMMWGLVAESKPIKFRIVLSPGEEVVAQL